MYIKLVLAAIGITIGYKNRANLLYIVYFLIPFLSLGQLKVIINIDISRLFSFLCFIPLILLFALDLITKKYKKDYFFIFASVIGLYLFILTKYPFSYRPDAFSLIVSLTMCITIFFYVIFNFNKIKPKILFLLTKILIFIETYIAISQYRGVSLTEIFPFIEISDSLKIIEVEIGNFYRAIGSFDDPNYYSLYMAILAASLLFYTDKFSAKIFFLIALVGIILSFSRMGIILMVILIIIYLSQKIRLKNVIVICTILSIIITGMYVFNFFDNYQQYPLVNNILYRFETSGTFQLDVIGYYFYDILNISNLLFGLGFENFEYALAEQIGLREQAHNQYIQMIADIGIIGLSPLLLLIFIFIKKYKLKLLSKKNPFLFSFIIILFGNMFLLNTFIKYIYLFCGLYIGFIIEKLNREVKS
jgi:hypothetical protein